MERTESVFVTEDLEWISFFELWLQVHICLTLRIKQSPES